MTQKCRIQVTSAPLTPEPEQAESGATKSQSALPTPATTR
jgi:hypothetical protein